MPYLAKYKGRLQLPPPRNLQFSNHKQLAPFSDTELENKHSSYIWVMMIPLQRKRRYNVKALNYVHIL